MMPYGVARRRRAITLMLTERRLVQTPVAATGASNVVRMSVDNLEAIHNWALRNQDAIPELILRLIFAADLAKSVIEQEAAPDPQRVIEIGYDIANLMWRIRVASGLRGSTVATASAQLAAGTRVILHVLRRGMSETAAVAEYIDNHVGKTVFAAEVVGIDPNLDLPEFDFREIAIRREGEVFIFEDQSDTPCRPSRIKNLSGSIRKAIQAG